MNSDKEKLIEVLQYGMDKYFLLKFEAEIFAELLIANGVTFAKDTNVPSKWVPVTERLPKESGMYIVTAYDGHAKRVTFVKWQKRNKLWERTGARSYWKITHWMPLPEAPKEE